MTFPNAFRNDPVLIVICGYEKFDLHKAGRWEKAVIFSLTVLTFFTITAYETKIVSMMISKPVTKEIRTFEDLFESGIKIRGNRKIHVLIDKNSSLGQITLSDPNTPVDAILQMDLEHAYLYDRDLSWQILPMYYDFPNRIYRYNAMHQSLSQYPKIFLTRPRTPLMDAFSYTLNCFIESGLHEYWAKTVPRFEWTLKELGKVQRSAAEETLNVLHFADFRPAWLPWLGGILLSTIVFIGEMLLNGIIQLFTLCKKNQRKIQSRPTKLPPKSSLQST